jgi:hypothetical protein
MGTAGDSAKVGALSVSSLMLEASDQWSVNSDQDSPVRMLVGWLGLGIYTGGL